MYSNTEMLELLIERVSQRQPTSVIRKGDGENLVLGYGVLPGVSRKWYFKKLYHFNVYPWQIAFQLFLRTELIRTYQNADFLGISLPEHRHGHWSLEEDILRLFGLEQIPSFDMNFHMALIKYPNEYRLVTPVAEKLVSGKRIGLITHRDLTEFFNHFESEVVVRLEIPKRRSRVHVMNRQRFDGILHRIDAHSDQVDVWFVGAGIYAKPFCNHIKACGGVGIDMGSSIDSWANDYQSRGHLRKFYQKHKPA